jgi:hypothetical protein
MTTPKNCKTCRNSLGRAFHEKGSPCHDCVICRDGEPSDWAPPEDPTKAEPPPLYRVIAIHLDLEGLGK